jgi:transposase
MGRRVRPIRAWKLAETGPAPQGNAAMVDAVLEQQLVRGLGALPLLLPVLERLGLRAVVNQQCQPEGSGADLDVGLTALVLVCNRLLAPQPLVHVETWLGQTALPERLGFEAGQANDDRLGRALDALVPHLEGIWQELVVRAIGTFDLDLSQLCYDLTSVSFFGAYEEAELITYGYSRDHRPDCKQIEIGATVTATGGVPIDYQTLAGNVADCTTPVANLRRLQRLLALLPARPAGQPLPLVISDRAMLTLESIAAYEASGVRYLGPLDPGLGHGAVRELLAGVTAEELAASPLGYRPQRAADDPAWEAYQGVPRRLLLRHPDPARPPLTVHALVVWSPGKARLDAGLRATHLTRLETALTDLAGKAGRRPYTTKATVGRRLATILARQPARQFVTVRIEEATEATEATAPALRLVWTHDATALAKAAALDGRYVLGTNEPTLDPEQMLASAKRRDVPEKRFALVKGPLAVRPVYLHKQERIQALAFCTMVALLVFALLELLAHRAGFTVSGQTLLTQFASLAVLTLILHDGSALRRITGLAPPLAAILLALGFPPADRYAVRQD